MKTQLFSPFLKAVPFAALVLVASPAKAAPLNLEVGMDAPYTIGEVINGVQGEYGGLLVRDCYMVNTLLDMPLNSQSVIPAVTGELFIRSGLAGGGDVDPVGGTSSENMGLDMVGAYIQLTLPTSFGFLVAAYDGPNGGVHVWDISTIAAATTLQIPRYAHPAWTTVIVGYTTKGKPITETVDGPLVNGASDGKYQITSWTLLQPGSVPDGGSTVALLGFAMLSINFVRRKFRRA